ncbi:hypothetical protein DCAR_0830910 [Daucus carota subsp. sativus]|uniref:Epidermal patterning factor-like protein n=1 Tax=Daucus carota subsp. sativus TaxID=79200 RepID=A0AAF0XR34_DAUCS|nr:hypothetical protein DCAR_0830910 [Daucus carota subsp. sativus]
MMRRKSCIFLLMATLQIISWFIAAAQPFSPLDHRALPLQKQEEKAYKLGRSRLGSRPPNCDHRCGECSPCIAIQVPTNTQQLHLHFANYEPEGWKCKCGSVFFTP